jgi:hypothetical protein
MWLKTKSLERLRLDLPCLAARDGRHRLGSKGKNARYLGKSPRLLAKTGERERLLPNIAQKVAGTRFRRTEASN